jgi:hypothetical protein
MRREFHIFASKVDDSFTVKAIGDGYPKEFKSLVEATQHVRTLPDCENGLVVMYDEAGAVNRIPFVGRNANEF